MTNPRSKKVDEINMANMKLRLEAEALFLGLKARFTNGRYAERWGLVTAVALDDRAGVTLLVQPFKAEVLGPDKLPWPHLTISTADLLYQHQDARSYRPVDQYEWADEYPPCKACNRSVPSPCNDSAGYHEGGPWDGSCRDVFYPGRDR